MPERAAAPAEREAVADGARQVRFRARDGCRERLALREMGRDGARERAARAVRIPVAAARRPEMPQRAIRQREYIMRLPTREMTALREHGRSIGARRADRCLAVDEKGNVITGDHILYIYGRYMKDREKLIPNCVVTTVMSNFGLYKAFDDLGIGHAQTKVGDRYVYEYMSQHGCRLGGEESGHIIFSKYATTGDGILTSLKLAEVMMARKKKMSELASDLVMYPHVLKNVRVLDKAGTLGDENVKKVIDEVAAELGDNGRILVRESGTEPVIRVMVEAKDPEVCNAQVDRVVSVIEADGWVVK